MPDASAAAAQPDVAATSATPTPPAADPNRIIAIVTGANSGFGLGICQALLTNLSVCGDTPVPWAVPSATSVPPALAPLLGSDAAHAAAATAARMPAPHPTLTLVLACRSKQNAVEARETLLAAHTAELAARRRANGPSSVPEGWEEGLRIEYELVDLDAVGGPTGLLAFGRRVAARYPHVTSLFLNAGYAAFTQVVIPRFMWQMVTDGVLHALHHPRYNIEEVGARSADGERGRVWGVNVLAPYILTKELAPLLGASPRSLPFEPRVVYTSSIEAEAESLHADPLADYQLLGYDGSYRASKYMGDLVVTALDRELAAAAAADPDARSVRVLAAEPGCVATNIAVAGLGAWQWLVSVKWVCYWLSFWLASWVLGSPHHPVWAAAGAAPMLYAAMVADAFLLPAERQPGPKVHVVARRWRTPLVRWGEVDEWEAHEDLATGLAERCEAIRLDWHKREAGGAAGGAVAGAAL